MSRFIGANMTLQRSCKVSGSFAARLTLLPALVFVGICHVALAQEAAQAPIETVDEIIVYGDKSLSTLRKMVFRAEENFFALFSAFNDDDEYDIRCFYEAPTGTRIRQHVCRAYFVTNATSAEANNIRTGGARYPVADARAVILVKKRRLREKMEALVTEYPELLQALGEYTDAKEVLKSARQSRCSEGPVICRQ
jgi:hypothetical protein